MRSFKHINASSVEEAAALLRQYGEKARIIAGGTDLLGEMKDDILSEFPGVLINIKNIPGLDYIRDQIGGLRIGALTRLEDIAVNDTVQDKYPLLAEAAHRTASPHIREMGTIAGNICQNNRCWYYWIADNRFNCLRKGGESCYALIGDGRYHSILGSSRIVPTPCSTACPAGVEIPDYMEMVRAGDLAGAARKLMCSNPLPAITGRVCPHFCEGECNRGDFDQPVSVRGVERSLGDHALNNRQRAYTPPANLTGKKVAVIGSGPAGLSAAYYLRLAGHEVTIFEKEARAGGLLTYGIPPFRLPKNVVESQLTALEQMGVRIITSSVVERARLNELAASFEAVLVACGAWKERPAGIGGEELLISGAEFLRKSNLGANPAIGKKVGVIGGGNVAIDVARSLLRLGSEPVIIYRRTRREMPALEDEIEKAEEEKIRMEFLTLPLAASRKDGRIALKCTLMKLGTPDESGRPRPVPVEGSEFILELDAVVKAIGEEADTSLLPAEFIDVAGRLKIKEDEYVLGRNLFAAGDFVSGPSTVVAAIAAGRKAADVVNGYLGTKTSTAGEKGRDCSRIGDRFNSAYLKKTGRVNPPELAAGERVKDLNTEDAGGLDIDMIEVETNRCFNCGCVAVNPSDMAPAFIALKARIKTNKREIEAEKFFAAGINRTTVLEGDEIVLEIEIPAPLSATKTRYIKFALRKSIDFPVVNCAAALTIQDGIVQSARICLNSVYNMPVRVTAAEEYMQGKPVNEVNAENAASSGLKDAFPVVNNSYKIQIARTLVKRAILGCVVRGPL